MITKSNNNNIFMTIVPILILLCISTNFSQSLNEQHLNELEGERTLEQHLFTPHNLISSPFIQTYIRSSLGMGEISNIQTALLEIGNEKLLYTQGDVMAALLSFEYQHAVKDWLAVNIQFGLVARLGTNISTAVTHGINYAASFNIGWMIKLYNNKRFYISSTYSLSNGNYSFISLSNFVNDVIDDVPNASLVSSNNVLFGTTGLRAAYGINKLIGLEILFDLGYGETIQRELDNKWFYHLGFNVDLNFSHLIKTPLSLSVGYLHSSYPKGEENNLFGNNIILWQLSYIGRSDMVLSLDFQYSRELYGYDGSTVWFKAMAFSMRYIF